MRDKAEAEAAAADPMIRREGAGGALHVLLVEGSAETRQTVTELLRQCSYQVTESKSGEEAMELMDKSGHGFDLVLADVAEDHTGAGGSSLLEKGKELPVIIMATSGDQDTVMKCLTAGASDYLVKPVRRNELENLWQHVWRRHNVSKSTGPADERAGGGGGTGTSTQSEAVQAGSRQRGSGQSGSDDAEGSGRSGQTQGLLQGGNGSDEASTGPEGNGAEQGTSSKEEGIRSAGASANGSEELKGAASPRGGGGLDEVAQTAQGEASGSAEQGGGGSTIPILELTFRKASMEGTGPSGGDGLNHSDASSAFATYSADSVMTGAPAEEPQAPTPHPNASLLGMPLVYGGEWAAEQDKGGEGKAKGGGVLQSPGRRTSAGGGAGDEPPGAGMSDAASRRLAALNKFRQKRKDRCFTKQVRYQSRKRLAEQRPRVRGQFVKAADLAEYYRNLALKGKPGPNDSEEE